MDKKVLNLCNDITFNNGRIESLINVIDDVLDNDEMQAVRQAAPEFGDKIAVLTASAKIFCETIDKTAAELYSAAAHCVKTK